MSNTYEYKVTGLVRDANDIVVTASFQITASDGTDSFTHSYRTGFANQPETPIPFASLTEADVIEWIKRDAGTENNFEQSADAELAAYKLRKSESVLTAGTPWSQEALSTPRVPQSVTRRQARQALLLRGKFHLVQPAIDAIPDATARGLMQIEWDDSQDFVRSRESVTAIGTAIGLDSIALDEIFTFAASLP